MATEAPLQGDDESLRRKGHQTGAGGRSVHVSDVQSVRKKGVRNTQGLFQCLHCSSDENADKNGATNIGKRVLGMFSKLLSDTRVVLARPETQVVVEPENSQDSVGLTPNEGTPRV